MKTLLALSLLVSSQITWIFPPNSPPQEIVICHYSDGAVITVPGLTCPASD